MTLASAAASEKSGGVRLCAAAAALLLLPLTSVSAQTIWAAGTIHQDVQRFADDGVPNRLDGSAPGWVAIAGVRAWRHLAFRLEWSDGASIDDTETFTVTVGSRDVTITSTFAHRTQALSALAGYTHQPGTRVQLAYVVGTALTSVRRILRTDAPDLLLLFPSNAPATGEIETTNDVVSFVGGVDVLIRVRGHVHIVSGVRAQALRLEPDVTGWSIRPFAGIGWAF
jgi:hypothetical protein